MKNYDKKKEGLSKAQREKFEKLQKFAAERGHGKLDLQSSTQLRTYADQVRMFNEGKSKLDGTKKISQHQVGRALDLQFRGGSFEQNLDKERLKKLKEDWEKETGENLSYIKWDMGHFEFPATKEEKIKAKGSYLFGAPKKEVKEEKPPIEDFVKPIKANDNKFLKKVQDDNKDLVAQILRSPLYEE